MTKKEKIEQQATMLLQLKMDNLYLWKKKEQYGGLLWALKQATEENDIELVKRLLDNWH